MRWAGWILRCADVCSLLPQGENLRFARARGRGDRAERKTAAQSTRGCLIEPLGRGNSEAIASRSLLPSIWNWAFSDIETRHMRSKIGALPLLLVGFLLG